MHLLRLSASVAVAALMAAPAFAQTAPATPAAPPAAAPAPTPAASGDIVETLRAKGQFNTFLKAAEAAGIVDLLKGAGPIAVFAPTDQAFAALPAGQLDTLMKPENKEQLRSLLLYHTINAAVTSQQLNNRKGPVPTGATTPVLLDGGGGQIKANDAKVVEADVKASNGTIFVIDKVLNPSAPAPAATSGGLAAASPLFVRAGFQTAPETSEPAEAAKTAGEAEGAPDTARSTGEVTPGTAPIPGGVPRDPGDGSSPANQGMTPGGGDGDIANRRYGDPGVTANTPVPNPPERPRRRRPN